jgi:hypothetical protein
VKNLALGLILTLAVTRQLAACAGTNPRQPELAWPTLDATVEGKQLAIDGLWQIDHEAHPAKYRLDSGRMYLHSDFASDGRFGRLRYRTIEQTGPRSFACEKLIRRDRQNHWATCRLSLEVDGTLVEENASLPELGVEAGASLFHPLEPDDAEWFRAQRRSHRLVSRMEAHRPPVATHQPPPDEIPIPPPPPPPEVVPAVVRQVLPFGPYHALVIGAGNYQYLPAVATAEDDANAVASLLEERYGFEVINLRNPGREQLLAALAKLQKDLGPRDNLLLYYSGHGWFSEVDGHCYWFPVDALDDNSSNWISNSEITKRLRAMEAKHVMVVVDSCYTGGQRHEAGLGDEDRDYHSRMSEKRTRVVLSSGGLEPVQAGNGGQHSVFTSAFLKVLSENEGVLDGANLYSQIQRLVSSKALQTPEYVNLREAEHEGGDFLFLVTP